MKFVKILVVAALLLVAPTAVFASDSIIMNAATVLVNGEPVVFQDQEPIFVSGRTLVPVRGVFEAMGFTVTWDAVARSVTLTRYDATVVVTQDSGDFSVNGAVYALEVPAQNFNGRIMIPLRAVVEGVGHEIDWDAATRTVMVTRPSNVYAVGTIAGMGIPGYADGFHAQFNLPSGIFGNENSVRLYIADTYNNLIRVIQPTGEVTTLAGTVLPDDDYGFPYGAHADGAVADALFNRPTDGAIDSEGRIFITDSGNDVIRVITDGNVFTFAQGFNKPTAIVYAPCGNLFVADTLNHAIRAVSPTGEVTTIAGQLGEYGFYDGASDAALFNAPMGITVCPDGRIFVADTGNHLIRVIENGEVRTIGGQVLLPSQVEWYETYDFDEVPIGWFAESFLPYSYSAAFSIPVGLSLFGDTLIIADSGNNLIRTLTIDGVSTTLAGTHYADHTDGTLAQSEFHLPRGVLVRGMNLYIADTGNNVIRIIRL